MRDHSMHDFRRFAKTARYLPTDNSVRPLNLLIYSLTHIVQERRCLTNSDIGPQFMSDCRGQNRDLDRVGQHILSITGAEVQATQNFQQFRLETMYIGFERGAFAFLTYKCLNLLPSFSYDVLDACRVNAPINDESGQSHACNLT